MPGFDLETVRQPLLYAGYWYDRELAAPNEVTGWYWLSVREYDPALRRFLQPDPSGIEGARSYVYVGDDPIDNTDPTGTFGCGTPVLGGLVCGTVDFFKGTYNFVVGDDIATLTSEHASGADKFLAVLDIASNAVVFIPVFGEGAEAARVAASAAAKVAARREVEEVSFDEAVRISKRLVRKTSEDEAESCAKCFPAGTPVATPKGERAIQSLKVGDSVLAEDPKTGKVDAEPVEAVIQDPVSPLMAIDLADGSSITVTADHPFWVAKGRQISVPGWLAVGQLLPGDHLRTAGGQDAVVAGLRYHVGEAAVYTLTVARDHTYFVGTAQVLVHNCEVRDPIPLTYEDVLDPQKLTEYLYKVAEKYGINLRGSGKSIEIVFDPEVKFGRTAPEDGGRIIRLGRDMVGEGEARVANTIAHELQHARDWLAHGRWTRTETEAIIAGENLELWIILKNG